jgi:pyrimidine dimer DNA glycosylase
MRLWSLHPKYLDPQGLVALWREALLAQAVLRGKTKGYRHHPQLERFSSHRTPRLAINAYLGSIFEEATSRGYEFDRSKIGPIRAAPRLSVTRGQLLHEWRHLLRKLSARNPALYSKWRDVSKPAHHPIFRVRPGPVASWERVAERPKL